MFMASIQTAANMFDRDEIKALPLSLQHSLIYTITPHTPAMITRWKYILKWIIPHFHKSAFFFTRLSFGHLFYSHQLFSTHMGLGVVIMECERIKSWKIKSLRNLTELGHRVKIFCSKVFADKKFKPNFWGNKAKLHGRLLTKSPDSKVYTFECKIFNIIYIF